MARRPLNIPLGSFVEHLIPEWEPEPPSAEETDRQITLQAYLRIPTEVLDDLRRASGGRIFDPSLPGDQAVQNGFYRSGARDLVAYILQMIEAAKKEAEEHG